MIVNLICVLVKSSEGIDLIVSAEGDGRIHQARGSLPQGPSYFWLVAVHAEATLDW